MRKSLKCHYARIHPKINLSPVQSNDDNLFVSCQYEFFCITLRRISQGAKITAAKLLITVIRQCV